MSVYPRVDPHFSCVSQVDPIFLSIFLGQRLHFSLRDSTLRPPSLGLSGCEGWHRALGRTVGGIHQLLHLLPGRGMLGVFELVKP
jgi:hypothetical protein